MADRIDRRRFLRRTGQGAAGIALLGGLPALLAACGDDDDEATTGAEGGTQASGSNGAASFGELAIQLSWIKNAEFAGNYVADSEGYYEAEGFSSVNLIGGGPALDPIAPIVAGQVLYGYTGSEQVAGAIREQDAPLKVIGTCFQRNPFCIVYMNDDPLTDAASLRGKTIGVQAANEPIWKAMLKINGITEGSGPDQVRRIPVEFDPSPLTSGEVDGFFSFITNEPNILRARGIDVGALSLADIGITLYQQLYTVTTETFENRRDELVAAMRAESKGWQRAIAEPDLAKRLTLEVYGKDLDLIEEAQINELADQAELIVAGAAATKGLFYMDDADLDANLVVLRDLGLEIDKSVYTNEILDEVYADGIDLLA